MAKRKVIHTIESVKTTVDEKNWFDGNQSDIEVTTLMQEEGETAVINLNGTQYSLAEMESLVESMQMVQSMINGVL